MNFFIKLSMFRLMEVPLGVTF